MWNFLGKLNCVRFLSHCLCMCTWWLHFERQLWVVFMALHFCLSEFSFELEPCWWHQLSCSSGHEGLLRVYWDNKKMVAFSGDTIIDYNKSNCFSVFHLLIFSQIILILLVKTKDLNSKLAFLFKFNSSNISVFISQVPFF